jgi:hypothetical protein
MKKRYYIFLVYLALVGLLTFSSGIMAKYVSEDDSKIDFSVGSILYFNYERSDLYRNNQVVPVIPSVYEEDGEKFTLLETMNVVPGDSLTYHFFVSNFNDVTGDINHIDGLFFPNTNATLSLPMKGEIYNVNSNILYREVPYDSTDTTTPSNNVWNNLVEGNYLDLPPVSIRKVKYEFRVTVIVDDQVKDTTHEDYFDAVLTIKLFINAASDE